MFIHAILLLLAGSGVSGVVVGPDGEPVPGARVSTRFGEVVSRPEEATAAAEDGSFRLDGVGVGRPVRIYAAAPRHGLGVSARLDLVGDERIVIRLPPGATIRGRVIGKEGRPLGAVEVVAYGAHAGLALRPPAVRTDARGRYVFPSLPSGEWKLAVRAEGHAPAARTGLVLEAGAVREDVDFALGEGRVLEGRLVDSEGRPVAGERVRLRARGFPLAGVAVADAFSGSDGRFRFPHLPDLSVSIEIGSERVHPDRQVLGPDESPVTLRAEVLGGLAGRIVVPGGIERPYRVNVFVIPTGARTPYPTWIAPSPCRSIDLHPDGGFVIHGFRPGVYDVIALGEGTISNRVSRVRIAPGESIRIDAPLVLAATGRVEGRTIDAAGKPVPDAQVALLTEAGQPAPGWMAAADSAAGGNFYLHGIPAGRYRLRATAADGREATVAVEVAPGETAKIDVTLP
jgi:hypothetical protein